ncbi:hypothetical protein SDC9_178013 [bioreactor metagenome]|uniref:Uncharacterized protein n=1 Tax=bioreactor metagenome TaxID=1076179 RepID=A0A645GWX5_9ZZZZ
MVGGAYVVAGAGVLPVVENDVADLRDFALVLLPRGERVVLVELNHSLAPAFGRHNVGKSELDRDRRDERRAPCVRVFHGVAPGEGLMGIVKVYDLPVRAVRLVISEVTPGRGDDELPNFPLGHNFTPEPLRAAVTAASVAEALAGGAAPSVVPSSVGSDSLSSITFFASCAASIAFATAAASILPSVMM